MALVFDTRLDSSVQRTEQVKSGCFKAPNDSFTTTSRTAIAHLFRQGFSGTFPAELN
jgi:hypothetical protein